MTICYGPSREDYSFQVDKEDFDGYTTLKAIKTRLQELVDDDAQRNVGCHADEDTAEQVEEWLKEG